MLLAIDIGNTNIVLGLYQGKKLITHWRLLTEAERTSDEYGVIIAHLVDYEGFHCNQISAIVVSCVVPPMLTMIQELGKKFFKLEPLIVGPGIKTACRFFMRIPETLAPIVSSTA
jgi:type III pantothenate kinase